MTRTIANRTTLIIAALALGAATPALLTPALAKSHQSGPAFQTAQDFADNLENEVSNAVEDGNYRSLVAAMAERINDGSTFHFSREIVLSDGPTTNYTLAVSGDELVQLARSPMGMQSMDGLVEEYELNVVVNAAWDVPGDASGAEIAFYESGTFGEREDDDEDDNGENGESGALPTGPFSSSTVCTMHLGGEDGGTILTASCTTTSLL